MFQEVTWNPFCNNEVPVALQKLVFCNVASNITEKSDAIMFLIQKAEHLFL